MKQGAGVDGILRGIARVHECVRKQLATLSRLREAFPEAFGRESL